MIQTGAVNFIPGRRELFTHQVYSQENMMFMKILLALMTFIFLIIVAPVFMFSMLAPMELGTILYWWTGIVTTVTLIITGLWLYIRWETD